MELGTFFSENPRVALAFSGGVDSAFLLRAALDAGADVTAYYVKSAFQPEFELNDAKRLAAELGAKMRLIDLDGNTTGYLITREAWHWPSWMTVHVRCAVTGFLAAFLNTALFMSSLVLLFRNTPTLIKSMAGRGFFAYVVAAVGVNGIVEMAVATLLTAAVGTALYKAGFIREARQERSQPHDTHA